MDECLRPQLVCGGDQSSVEEASTIFPLPLSFFPFKFWLFEAGYSHRVQASLKLTASLPTLPRSESRHASPRLLSSLLPFIDVHSLSGLECRSLSWPLVLVFPFPDI